MVPEASPPYLKVVEVHADSAVFKYNESIKSSKPNEVLRSTDKIVKVNGVGGDQQMVDAMRNSTDMLRLEIIVD